MVCAGHRLQYQTIELNTNHRFPRPGKQCISNGNEIHCTVRDYLELLFFGQLADKLELHQLHMQLVIPIEEHLKFLTCN